MTICEQTGLDGCIVVGESSPSGVRPGQTVISGGGGVDVLGAAVTEEGPEEKLCKEWTDDAGLDQVV